MKKQIKKLREFYNQLVRLYNAYVEYTNENVKNNKCMKIAQTHLTEIGFRHNRLHRALILLEEAF